jgi:hypothetical protein
MAHTVALVPLNHHRHNTPGSTAIPATTSSPPPAAAAAVADVAGDLIIAAAKGCGASDGRALLHCGCRGNSCGYRLVRSF